MEIRINPVIPPTITANKKWATAISTKLPSAIESGMQIANIAIAPDTNPLIKCVISVFIIYYLHYLEVDFFLVLHFNRNNLERVLHQMENEHNIITRRNGLLELAGRDDDRIIEQQNQFEIDAVKEAIEHGNTTVAAMKE